MFNPRPIPDIRKGGFVDVPQNIFAVVVVTAGHHLAGVKHAELRSRKVTCASGLHLFRRRIQLVDLFCRAIPCGEGLRLEFIHARRLAPEYCYLCDALLVVREVDHYHFKMGVDAVLTFHFGKAKRVRLFVSLGMPRIASRRAGRCGVGGFCAMSSNPNPMISIDRFIKVSKRLSRGAVFPHPMRHAHSARTPRDAGRR
jgi:hypothetical protein